MLLHTDLPICLVLAWVRAEGVCVYPMSRYERSVFVREKGDVKVELQCVSQTCRHPSVELC